MPIFLKVTTYSYVMPFNLDHSNFKFVNFVKENMTFCIFNFFFPKIILNFVRKKK